MSEQTCSDKLRRKIRKAIKDHKNLIDEVGEFRERLQRSSSVVDELVQHLETSIKKGDFKTIGKVFKVEFVDGVETLEMDSDLDAIIDFLKKVRSHQKSDFDRMEVYKEKLSSKKKHIETLFEAWNPEGK